MIALDHTTVAAPRAHRDRQFAEADAFGPGYRASGYVITNLNGDPMALTGSAARSGNSRPRPDCPRSGTHDLRHGAATLALAAGVDLRTVQEQLSHSNIVVTADTYTSGLPSPATCFLMH